MTRTLKSDRSRSRRKSVPHRRRRGAVDAGLLYFSRRLGQNILLNCGRIVPAVWHSWHVALRGPSSPWLCRRHASAGLSKPMPEVA